MRLDNDVEIKEGNRPYIVAELNSSHNGKVERARQTILAAKDCGCDCVKFQSWTAESLYSDEYYFENPISKRIVESFSLDEAKLEELIRYCTEIGIDWSSTPYSKSEVDFLVKMDAPFIKISSMEINNFHFLEYIGKTMKPIVLSTGMSSYEEIDRAVETIKRTGNNNVCILHCVSVYPAEANMVNLKNMLVIRERFPDCAVGYSDHTVGSEAACAAVALGASLIEKHFTLDNSKMGMDNNMAAEPAEMRELVHKCHTVFESLGCCERELTEAETEQRKKMRRSVVAKVDIKEGTTIDIEMLEFKRPGTGIAPGNVGEIVGRKAKRDIKKGFLIFQRDV